jgi:hypothetical protein
MRKRENKTEYNVSKSRVPGFGTFLSFRRKAICNCSGMNRTSCEVDLSKSRRSAKKCLKSWPAVTQDKKMGLISHLPEAFTDRYEPGSRTSGASTLAIGLIAAVDLRWRRTKNHKNYQKSGQRNICRISITERRKRIVWC